MDCIPDDPLVEILSHLPAKPLCRSKCASKAWRDLITARLCRDPLEGFFYGFVDDLVFISVETDGEIKEGGEDKEGGKDDGKGSSKHDNLQHHVRGHFASLSARPVPLIDPSFSFLRKHPGIENITLLDSCNGLLLFAHTRDKRRYETPLHLERKCNTPGYIVCNPATEHWVHVPSSASFLQSTPSKLCLYEDSDSDEYHVWQTYVEPYLLFDPTISQHFRLIELGLEWDAPVVQAYSFEKKRWRMMSPLKRPTRWKRWDYLVDTISHKRGSTFFKGLLHVLVSPEPHMSDIGLELIAAINGKGQTSRIISWWVGNRGFPVFVGQSQKLLHCISSNKTNTEMYIWILKDYDSDTWSLEHTVSFLELFGRRTCLRYDYNVVTIHPEKNLVFLVQNWDYNLISYDMDHKKVDTLCNVGCDYGHITPYFPYFSVSPALSKNH